MLLNVQYAHLVSAFGRGTKIAVRIFEFYHLFVTTI
jgi:hypothetical protein